MHSGNAGGNGHNITAGTNTMAVVMLPLITNGGNTSRVRWHLHHSRMVRRFGVDRSIITVGWYSDLALIDPLSPPVGTLTQR